MLEKLEELQKYIENSTTQSQPTSATTNMEFYSGAAKGSDTAWKDAASKLGIKTKDYTGESYKNLSAEWRDKIEKEYVEARAFLGKPIIPIKVDIQTATKERLDKDGGILTRRDMM
jgi:hypothetical protein